MKNFFANEEEMIKNIKQIESNNRFILNKYGVDENGIYYVEYAKAPNPSEMSRSEVLFVNDKYVLKTIEDQVILIFKDENKKIKQYITVDEDEDGNTNVRFLI